METLLCAFSASLLGLGNACTLFALTHVGGARLCSVSDELLSLSSQELGSGLSSDDPDLFFFLAAVPGGLGLHTARTLPLAPSP